MEAALNAFEPLNIYVPTIMYSNLQQGKKDNHVQFLSEYWQAKAAQVDEAWSKTNELFKKYPIYAIPKTSGDDFDGMLGALLREPTAKGEKLETEEINTIFELISLSRHEGIPILAFSSSSIAFIEKLKEFKEKLKKAGITIKDKMLSLHNYKQDNIAPPIQKRLKGEPVLFSILGGAIIIINPVAGATGAGGLILVMNGPSLEEKTEV